MNDETKAHYEKSLDKGIRFDGRNLEDYREISVEVGVIATAEGSARVKIGDTIVLAGVKTEIGKPYPDSPQKGNIMVNAELLPMSNPGFEMGPPPIEAIELARVVDRGIRESGAVDFEALCIEPGEKVWTIVVDICPLNDGGNLLDAASLAAILAMRNARFPVVEDDVINYKELTEKALPLSKIPIEVTVVKIGKHLIVDPTPEEEDMMDARLTVAVLPDGTLCALQKGGDMPLKVADVERMVNIACEKAQMLASIVEGA